MPAKVRGELFYGWIVVIAAFLFCFVLFGTRFSYGVFFKSIEAEFALGRAETSSIFSAYMIVSAAFGVIGGWALDRYGPRRVGMLMGIFAGISLIVTSQVHSLWQVFISYSLLLGIGTGSGYVLVMSTTSRWFTKKRGIALGIVGSGVGLGMVGLNPLSEYLIYAFDWRTAFLVLGILVGLISIGSAQFLRKDPAEMGLLPDGAKPGQDIEQSQTRHSQQSTLSVFQAFRTRSYWLLATIWFSWALSLHLLLTHLVPHLTDVGIPAAEAASVAGIFGAVSVPGRVSMGWLADRMAKRGTAIICCLLQAGSLLWLMWAHEPWGFYLFVLLFGFGYGGLDPPTLSLVGELFGVRNMGIIMGSLSLPWGLGAAIGPALGGFIFDRSHSYFLAFLLGAVAMLLATISVAFLRREKIRD